MTNDDVVRFLETIADTLEIKGERPYRIRAYREAARQVDVLEEDVTAVAAERRLTAIPRVGASLAARMQEFIETGESSFLADLQRDTPATLLDLLELPGFGPRRVAAVHRELGVTTLDELAAAAATGRLRSLRAIGPRLEQSIVRGIEVVKERRRRVPLLLARPLAEALRTELAAALPGWPVAIVGSVRRMAERVGDIDLLVGAPDAATVLDAFAALSDITALQERGATTAVGATRSGTSCHVIVAPPSSWGAALVATTGSHAHRRRLLALPGAAGWQLDGDLIVDEQGQPVVAPTEAAFYRLLGLPEIPPVLREDRGEIEAAQAGTLPDVVSIADIRGDLHVHSIWSDGRHSIEAMARAAQERGLSYVVMADHSRSSVIAGGMSVAAVAAQREEIAAVNARLDGFRVLAGIELDIKQDGSLDYDDEVLATFDFVTASVHSGFGQSAERITDRVLAAIRSPHVDAIGHPTGRLLSRREPLALDMDAVIEVAAETGTALEINANPDRLDLNDEYARQAAEAGVRLAINTDAHAVEHLAFLEYGIATAQRGWVRPQDVLNTRPPEALIL